MSKARDYVGGLAARGRYHFTAAEMRQSLGVSPAAAKQALLRLAKQGQVASPARGFYVIVPPEYRQLGCLPADQFIPALMEQHKLTYYAGFYLPRSSMAPHIIVHRSSRSSSPRSDRSRAAPSASPSSRGSASLTYRRRASTRRAE